MRSRDTDGFNHPRFVAMGEELRRLMMGPALTQQKLRSDALCICGREHRQLWPRTVRSQYGHGFNVTYYCSNSCKSRAAQQDSR